MFGRLTRIFFRIAKTLAALASLWSAPALEAQTTDVREQLRKRMSPLLAAVDGNDLRNASDLLASGADPNALSKSSTPLERALFNKNKEMVSLLLKHGANPRAIDTIGQSNLQIAFERDPALGAWLLVIKKSLYCSSGFVPLPGFDPARYSSEESIPLWGFLPRRGQ